MIGLIPLLALLALIVTVASAAGKSPLWPAVFILCVLFMLQVWGR